MAVEEHISVTFAVVLQQELNADNFFFNSRIVFIIYYRTEKM